MFNFAVVGSLLFSHTLDYSSFLPLFVLSLWLTPFHSSFSQSVCFSRWPYSLCSIASLVTQFTKQSKRRVCKQANKWSSWRYTEYTTKGIDQFMRKFSLYDCPTVGLMLCNDMFCHCCTCCCNIHYHISACLLNSGHRYTNMYRVRHNFTTVINWNCNCDS